MKAYARSIVDDADRAARVIERFTAEDVRAVARGSTMETHSGGVNPMRSDSLSALTDEGIERLSGIREALDKNEAPVEVQNVHYKLLVALDSGGRSLGRLRGTMSDCLLAMGDNACFYAVRHSLDQVAAAAGMYVKHRCDLTDSLRTRGVELAAFTSGNPNRETCTG